MPSLFAMVRRTLRVGASCSFIKSIVPMKKSFLAFPLAALFAACGPQAAEDPDHGHDLGPGADHHGGEELEPLAYTVYTDSTELFVEFKPLIVGQESRFAAHFTRTGALYTAITRGTASVALHSIGSPMVVIADAPSSPGIFRMAITPKQEGGCKLIFILNAGGRTDTLEVDGLTVYPDAHEAIHGERPQDPPGDITYLKEQAWKIPFALEQVARGAFAASVRVGAEVEPAISGEQVLSARSTGVVHLLGNAPLEGMSVKSGQTLFTLSSQGIAQGNAGTMMRQARNDHERAKADLERVETLYKDKLATQQELLRARNDLANAEAVLDHTASAQDITANMDGYVRSLHVREGQFVEAGTVLATLARNTRLSIHADVPVQAFARLGGVTSARIRAQDGRVYTLEQLNGRVLSVGQSADRLYVPVRLEVDGSRDLLPGSVVEVWLVSPTTKDALSIPLSAVLEQEGRDYCYVQTAGETMDKRTITLGANDGLRVEVREGLLPGERVVSIGAMDVKLATASGAIPAHGHEH